MGGAKPPPAPDPATVSDLQTQSNLNTATAQSQLNNVNQVGPYGSTTFSSTPGVGGVPSWTETTNLNPTLAGITSGTENIGASLIPTGQNLATQFGQTGTTPLNVNQTANNAMIAGGPQALYAPTANAIYQEQAGFLAPTYAQQQQDLQNQLGRQGISVGNQAYSNAETQLANAQNQGYSAARDAATAQGAQQANNMFGLAIQGQNQNIGQQQTQQQNPLALLSQLYSSGTVQA
jgi:hypothetical protein